ncbi:glutathione S-transferase family protein [Piscinibacter sp. HJYY11]|uniref:glutathione S-transferase family protein n=1 Tax=Piscinibacter sp. HJYY11 TaxID=2801333 RepID=UPI00191CC608|nr:glutathione S-transferase family protein [Piscinibacter sp. HJYY11]MBL0730049.1 glutathione S-transferase family protein [Piscinibacter sp. HJYY11]
MKLYNAPIPAPNPRRVRIFLAEKGLSLPLEDVSIRDRAHKSPEFRQKNSLGQLPVLELDDGSHLCESVAICRYLEELHPSPPLFGRTALERATVDMWIRRIELTVMTAVGAVWVHTHPFTARLGTQYKDYGESNRERYAKALQWLDRELEGREFVTGREYTMADIIGLTTVDFARFIGLDMPADTPHLHAWHARVSARPSAQA